MTGRTATVVAAGVVVALALAVGVSRWASPEPDGLERVAADHGLDEGEEPHPFADGPFADYETSGFDDPDASRGTAGAVGVALTFVVAGGAALLVSRRASRRAAHDGSPAAP